MPKVFVVNKGFHDGYEKASTFGELVPLTEGRVNVFGVDNLVHKLCEALVNAKADDYVLQSGYNLINSVVTHYFLKKFGHVKLLLWEANRDKYMAVTMKDFPVSKV